MKTLYPFIILAFVLVSVNANDASTVIIPATDYVKAFTDTITNIHDLSADNFMKMHCNSIKSVIQAKKINSKTDTGFIKVMYDKFNNTSDLYNAKKFSSYTARRKSLIMSWVSPTDGAVSFSWLKLPKDWDPEQEYPMYIQLHGKWDVADNSIRYLAYPYQNDGSYQLAFEDGYLLSPWGRGNLWYENISETDIWECIDKLNSIAKIDHKRMYLSGHSMGGFGSWSIASKSPNFWAAIGVHAGAIWYSNSKLVNTTVANNLKNLPVYFVCGDADGNLSVNQSAYQLLNNAGNKNVEFVTFSGGHEYIEDNVYNMYAWMKEFENEDWVDLKNTELNSGSITLFPNPVNDISKIKYTIPVKAMTSIKLHDLYGRVVANILNEVKNPGSYEIPLNKHKISGGIYFLKLSAGNIHAETKLIFTK